jgi:sulfide:quinone oxidoreductase
MVPRMEILIAGGGVAGLEGLLALHRSLGDRARLVLIAPDADFTYRPPAVGEPFGLGHAHRVPLQRFAADTGAELVLDAVAAVDDAAREVRLGEGGIRSFDALLLAPGGRAVAGVPGATTWWPAGDSEVYGGLLRDLEEGYTKRLAIVVPPGAVWPLPAYELALMTAGEVRDMGQDDVAITVVTPEHAPLSLFGDEASQAVAEELRWAGVELLTGAVARRDGGELVLEPSGRRIEVGRTVAVPRIVGPAIEGMPSDGEGFVRAGADARVEGCERTWAAGDGVVSPVKFGGLATHQARRAAAAIARLAGAEPPDPGEPVLHGRLLVGHRTRRLTGTDRAAGAPLWWPHGKIAGDYLPRWLAEHGVAPPAAQEPPAEEGAIEVRRPVSAMRGEARER